MIKLYFKINSLKKKPSDLHSKNPKISPDENGKKIHRVPDPDPLRGT